jgi:ADP-heptose:LPS heptosyltransferase
MPQPVVLRYGALGDMVMTTPLLRALHQRYGQPSMVIALGGWVPSLCKNLPYVGAIHTIKSRKAPYLFSPDQWALVAALRAIPDPAVYVLSGDEEAAALIKRAGLPIKASCYGAGFIPNEHQVDNHCRLAGFDAKNYDRKPQLIVSDAEKNDAHTWMNQRFGSTKTIFVHVGNKKTMSWRKRSNNVKEWPRENWTQLIKHLMAAKPDHNIALTGAAGERPMTQAIVDQVNHPHVTSIAGETNLRRLFAALSLGHSCISVDTGPAHAAAAIGCPLIVLFGATDPRINGPISTTAPVHIVTGPKNAPILDGEAGWAAHHAMNAIAVADVVEAWGKL